MNFLDFNGLRYFYHNKVRPLLNYGTGYRFWTTGATGLGTLTRDTVVVRDLDESRDCRFHLYSPNITDGVRITLVAVCRQKPTNPIKYSIEETSAYQFDMLAAAVEDIGVWTAEIIKAGGVLRVLNCSDNFASKTVIPHTHPDPKIAFRYFSGSQIAEVKNITGDTLIYKDCSKTTAYNKLRLTDEPSATGYRISIAINNNIGRQVAFNLFSTPNNASLSIGTYLNCTINMPNNSYLTTEIIRQGNDYLFIKTPEVKLTSNI